jgi:hypothetical protein
MDFKVHIYSRLKQNQSKETYKKIISKRWNNVLVAIILLVEIDLILLGVDPIK